MTTRAAPLPAGSPVFSKQLVVPDQAIDVNGHVSNLAYVEWMQQIAIEHSEAAGWPLGRYVEIGAGWVVRSHFIEYLRPAFAGNLVGMHTWVPRFDQRSTPRRSLFVRASDRRILARAETQWAFVDLSTGRRRALPPELIAAFAVIADDREVLRLLGLAR